jgi:hypothetical protein
MLLNLLGYIFCVTGQSAAFGVNRAKVPEKPAPNGDLPQQKQRGCRLRPLSVNDLAVLALPNITRSIDYRHPAYPARHDPTC